MKRHLLAAAFALVLAPVAAFAADDDNPYKNAKVGDFAVYKVTVAVAGMNLGGELKQEVTAKTEKELTLKVTGKVAGQAVPEQSQKIDLTKPFDPTNLNQQLGKDAKVEKGKDGTEKIKFDGKEYETKWSSFKITGKAMNIEIESDMKVWLSKDIPGVLAKMESTMNIAGQKMEMKLELSEVGKK